MTLAAAQNYLLRLIALSTQRLLENRHSGLSLISQGPAALIFCGQPMIKEGELLSITTTLIIGLVAGSLHLALTLSSLLFATLRINSD